MKRIALMIGIILLLSSFASAGFLDYFRGDGLRDVTGEQVKSAASSSVPTNEGGLPRFGILNLGASKQISSGSPLQSGTAELSVVSSEAGKTTLKLVDTISVTVGEGFVIGDKAYSVAANDDGSLVLNEISALISETRGTDGGTCACVCFQGSCSCTDSCATCGGCSGNNDPLPKEGYRYTKQPASLKAARASGVSPVARTPVSAAPRTSVFSKLTSIFR